MTDASIPTIFDADNHYWEPSDAFTRHRDPKFMDRGIRVVDVEETPRYYVNGAPHPILPGPGDAHPRPRPGALYDYFAGRSTKASLANELSAEGPGERSSGSTEAAISGCGSNPLASATRSSLRCVGP
jgi:hypothetical protein